MPIQKNRGDAGEDGTVRKAHYGEGHQPWDTMVDLGVAQEFAVGSILKYLRRAKDPEHSLESAQWYYNQLYKHGAAEGEAGGPWSANLGKLERVLSRDELKRLRGVHAG